MTSLYRGSLEHKDRPSTGRKGTLCPEWTHTTADTGFLGNSFQHSWEKTLAHSLFDSATLADHRRFATARGIAFESKPTGDGTWHGFPIPWESVPPTILNQWLSDGKVSRREVKLNKHREASDIRWAMGSDEP